MKDIKEREDKDESAKRDWGRNERGESELSRMQKEEKNEKKRRKQQEEYKG